MSDESPRLNGAEWEACALSYEMLDDLRAMSGGQPDWRRMRLFSCSCCRTIWHHLTDERSRAAVEAAERYVDGGATAEEMGDAAGGASTVAYAARKVPFKDAAWAATKVTGRDEGAWMGACSASRYAAEAHAKSVKKASERESRRAQAHARQAGLVRCIFGNPFQPVQAAPAWLTPDVTQLAEAAYEERLLPSGELDPARLAVLADALEEAGASGEILAHLRSPDPHVRGCWAVDAALGRDASPPPPPVRTPAAAPAAPVENLYAPCFGGQNEDGTFSLAFTDFGGTAGVFEEAGHEGGGYGWHAVVDALVRMRAPELSNKLCYDPEGGMFAVTSSDGETIRRVAELIGEAATDPALLRQAIGKADPDLMNP